MAEPESATDHDYQLDAPGAGGTAPYDPHPQDGTGHTDDPGYPPAPPPAPGCEPGVDTLKCVAAGDKAKAEYHDTFQAALAQAALDYEATRRAYRDVRHDAARVVQDLENEVRHLVDRIRCQFESTRVWRCLDEAFEAVRDELGRCPVEDRCCVEECAFPLEGIETRTVAELSALIEQYQGQADAARVCFTGMLGEPTALGARVDAARTEVASITAALGGDQATLDLKRLYARALVVQWRITTVWGPYPQTQSYVDCLCQALTCWTQGCHAVYQLTGARAVALCQDQARTDRCAKLATETVEQVLAEYDRLCARSGPKDPYPTGEGEQPGEGHHEHDDCDGHHHHDCGCHHHHHHHHGEGAGDGPGYASGQGTGHGTGHGTGQGTGGGKDCGCR